MPRGATPREGSRIAEVLDLMGSGKRVLSLECGSGRFVEFMKANGCVLTGIENSPGLADAIHAYCEEVIVADLDSRSLADVLPGRLFDVVLFGDVLERLRDPGRLLDEARGLLAPQGFVVLSIPDVAQSLRASALETEVMEVQGLLRSREDALLALIEQRATLEFESDERIGQLDRDLATAIDRETELARISEETAERIAQLEADAERFSALEKDYHDLLRDFETHVAKQLEEIRREGHEVHELTRAIQRSPFWSMKLAVRRLYRFGRE
jgi:SAM-dependent methyltransferase